MKLESVTIRDLRAIQSLHLPFTDELEFDPRLYANRGYRISSGKTTILDAIRVAVMSGAAETYQFREGLRLTPAALVRRGAVTLLWTLRSGLAMRKSKQPAVMEKTGNPYHRQVPRTNQITVHWKIPDPQGKHCAGFSWCDPPDGWLLFRGRKILAKNLHVPGLGSRDFRRLGSIILFDQQRTGLAKRLSSHERSLLAHLIIPEFSEADAEENSSDPSDYYDRNRLGPARGDFTTDPRLILTSLAMRARVSQDPEATEQEDFAHLKALYERVCHPHTIGDLYNTDHGLDMEFGGDQGKYYYDGLSSGQEMILLLPLQFATRRIHHSIVLIDELELHLHPLWQDRLYAALTSLGNDNQFIFTTDSSHLRDTIRAAVLPFDR